VGKIEAGSTGSKGRQRECKSGWERDPQGEWTHEGDAKGKKPGSDNFNRRRNLKKISVHIIGGDQPQKKKKSEKGEER